MQTPELSRSGAPAFAYLVVGLAGIAAFFVAPASWQNPFFDTIGLSAVVVIVIGTIRNRPADPWAWHLMAAGQFLFVAGDITWTIYEAIIGVSSPDVSFADALYLAGYVPLAAGLLLIVRARRPGQGLTRLIDAAILTVAAAVAAWVFLIAPQAARVGASEVETILALAYPSADVLLITVAAVFVFTTQTRAFASRLIGLSLIALLVSDILYIPGTLNEWYDTGHPVDAGWLLSYVLWGTAALHPSMRRLTRRAVAGEAPRFTRRRLVVESLAVIAIPVMWGIQTLRGEMRHTPVVVAASTLASFLIITRTGGLLTALEGAALHDPLTGLPNRRLLLDRMAQAFRRAERAGTSVAVLFLDLHGYKEVNDRFGHEAGDEALIEVTRRIRSAVRGADTVARFGGDEFIVVGDGLDRLHAEMVAHRIRAAVATPLQIEGELVELAIDLGIAIEENPSEADVSALLRAADRAMYQAKSQASKRKLSS